MDSIEMLETTARFLKANPGFLRSEAHAKNLSALRKALLPIMDLSVAENRKSSKAYNDLRQALGHAQRTKRIDGAWIKKTLASYRIKAGKGKDPLEVIAAAVFDAGKASVLIMELQKSSEALMQDAFANMMSQPPSEAATLIDKQYKGAALQKFCAANGVEPVFKKSKKTGVSTFDAAGTRRALLEKLERLRNRV